MKMECWALAALLVFALSESGNAQPSPATPAPGESAKTFLADALRSDLSVIKLGELAENNSDRSEIRSFGNTLVTDHTKAQHAAKEAAQQIDLTPPDRPSDAAESEYDRLSKLKGVDFDREFTRYMVERQQQDIHSFQAEADAKAGPTSDLAARELPTLQKNLQKAQTLAGKQQASAP